MPQSPSPASSSSNFQSIINVSLKSYEKQTKKDLLAHPLAAQLQSCSSPSDILAVLQNQVDEFGLSHSGDGTQTRWLISTVNVLYAFSVTLGEGVGLVFSPAKVIFVGFGVLLLAAKDVSGSQDALVDLFERIESFFKRVETYTDIPPTAAMTDMIVKIMVEVLNILALATKEIRQGRAKNYLKKLAGSTDIEDALKRLDKLTQEEARMAIAQVLRLTHDVDSKVKIVIEGSNEAKETAKEANAIMLRMANNVDEVMLNQRRLELRGWLSPPDSSTNQNIACSYQHKGSAGWFFRESIFEEWQSVGSLLWIHGKPGSGKSVLCSSIIRNITILYEANLATMAYFYFDFRDTDKQTRHNLLLSLVTQLSTRSTPCCEILSRIYRAHENGARQPSDDVLKDCLTEMLSLPARQPNYIILDALDESPNTYGLPSPREQVLELVKELVELPLTNLRICITSRSEIDIRTVLQPLTSLRVSLHDQGGQHEDIFEYVNYVVNSDQRMRQWREDDKKMVIKTLCERADGMFRWVFCQLESLRYCLRSSIRRFLNELPETLDETYERILREINRTNGSNACRLLQCLAVASRPLCLEELAEILALDFEGADGGIPKLNTDWRWGDQEQAVLSTCSSLIIVDASSRVVQFSHFSVKEFLTSARLANSIDPNISRHHVSLEVAHTILAQSCLGVLLCLDEHVGEECVKKFPLVEYAAEHWVDHAQFGNVSSCVQDGMEVLFDSSKPHFAAWLRVHDMDGYWVGVSLPYPVPIAVPLYYAALCGFYDLAARLIVKHPEQVNASGGRILSPLLAALHRKHFRIAELLYHHGAVVDIRCLWERTPLHAASLHGTIHIVRWLLDHGANANSREDEHGTPLHMGASHGHLDVCQLLIDRDADIHSRDDLGHVPLHRASERGHLNVVLLLLDCGADANACRDSERNWTPLHLAASNGHADIAHLLIDHNADINSRDDRGCVPLHRASKRGHLNVVRVLLECGADSNARDERDWTPLHLASSKGRLEVVRLLLKHGVDPDVENIDGNTPFRVALAYGHEEIMRLLREYGCQVQDVDIDRGSALQIIEG